MEKKNIIPVVLLSISCFLFLTAIILMLNSNSFSFKNSTEKQDNNANGVKENINVIDKNNNKEQENKVDNNGSSINQNEASKDVNTSVVVPNKNETTTVPSNTPNINVPTNTATNSPINTNKPNSSTNNQVGASKDENVIINYFKNQEVSTFSNVDQDNRTMREKAKDAFVGIVDFIFYDKEIKGYTFKGLTNSAKLQVIKIALSIDSKIDQYFPDYKDVMKDKYSNIKGKLAVKYLEFTASLCESVGENTCNQAKEDFNKMKESFGFTWQFIKELAVSGSSKVKDFYESWRDSE